MASPAITRSPFAYAAAAVGVVTVAVFRLPESFVEVLERNALLQNAAAGWVLRLLTLAAVGQAAYVGFVVLGPERIASALESERGGRQRIAVSLAWNSAAIASLTLLYGIAAFLTTGQRGGFWLFVLVAIAQIAWYFRLTGNAIEWLGRQPEPQAAPAAPQTGSYCPPLARGVSGGHA